MLAPEVVWRFHTLGPFDWMILNKSFPLAYITSYRVFIGEYEITSLHFIQLYFLNTYISANHVV